MEKTFIVLFITVIILASEREVVYDWEVIENLDQKNKKADNVRELILAIRL